MNSVKYILTTHCITLEAMTWILAGRYLHGLQAVFAGSTSTPHPSPPAKTASTRVAVPYREALIVSE